MSTPLVKNARFGRFQLASVLPNGQVRDSSLQNALDTLIARWALADVDTASFGVLANAAADYDCSITAADATLTSPNNPWTADDVGKPIHVAGAGAAGVPLLTTILTFTNAGSVELAVAASTTVAAGPATAGGVAVWGTAFNFAQANVRLDEDGNTISTVTTSPAVPESEGLTLIPLQACDGVDPVNVELLGKVV